jgi:hypothetical protein
LGRCCILEPMVKRKEKEIPRLIIEESPANDLYLVLDNLMTSGTHLARQAIEDIREEGEEFSRQAEGKEFMGLIATEFFQDNEKVAGFLSRIETILKKEPRLLAISDVIAKYLREMKPLEKVPPRRGAMKFQSSPPGRKKSPQGNDFYYFLLGLFSLARNAVASSDSPDTPHSVVNPEESPTVTEQPSRQSAAKTRRTASRRSKSSLLR